MTKPKSYKSWLFAPIHQAERRVSLHLEAHLKELGVSTPEAHLLSFVGRCGPCAVGELLRGLTIRRTTMTSILDRMERRGFVRRTVNSDDRRSFIVEITETGQEVVTQSAQLLERFEKRVRKLVSRQSTEGLREILSAIDAATELEAHGANDGVQ